MVEPVRHRQTKEAATDMFGLQPPRHISTLPTAAVRPVSRERPVSARLVHCHRPRRTSFDRTDSRRSALAVGTGIHAPFRPFSGATEIGAGGEKRSLAARA